MISTVVIGIAGEAGSGKSTSARFLRESFSAQPLSFAYPLKKICQDVWGFSDEQVFGEADVKERADPRTGIVPRWAMKKLGQSMRDRMGNDIFIEKALEGVSGGLYVIEDVRYRNEAAHISALSTDRHGGKRGFVFRLHCSDSVSTDDGTHPSEAEVKLINPVHVFREIHSSRAQGSDHLRGEVERAVKDVLKLVNS